MHSSLEKLSLVKNKVNQIVNEKQLKIDPKIIVVTKTFPLSKIMPLLENGHIHYAENKIQEAENKWIDIKKRYKNLQLHMVGQLQTNKAKKAVKLFIQVNLAEESRKSGIMFNELNNFYNYCTKDLSLNVIGLMCMPPVDSNFQKCFEKLQKAAGQLNLEDLSMGMSSDYEQAILSGSTYLRLGTVIMGERNSR